MKKLVCDPIKWLPLLEKITCKYKIFDQAFESIKTHPALSVLTVFLLAGCTSMPTSPVSSAQPPAVSVVATATTKTWSALPLRTVGRVQSADSESQHQWPAIFVEGRFDGDGIGFNNDQSSPWTLYIDEKPIDFVNINRAYSHDSNLEITYDTSSDYWIIDLNEGEHLVRFEKASETQYMVGKVPDIRVSGRPLSPPPPREQRIAFYGDSLTVGYGNTWPLSGGNCTPEVVHERTNTSLAFPALTAKYFKADYQIMAFSGIGMVRNYGGFEHENYRLPMLMDRTFFDDPTPYDHNFKPQIIHINVGSNDFSTPLHDGEKWKNMDEFVADFSTTYIGFVKKLRTENPDALIIIATPFGAEKTQFSATVETIYARLKIEGITNIARLKYDKTEDTGCHSHPNLADHQMMAQTLINFIEAHETAWATLTP